MHNDAARKWLTFVVMLGRGTLKFHVRVCVTLLLHLLSLCNMLCFFQLEVSKNMELPQTPHQEHVHKPSTDHEVKRSENGKAEEQVETLNLEMLQQEFARIIKERESLKFQQRELVRHGLHTPREVSIRPNYAHGCNIFF